VRAEIVAIGTELLLGQIVDSNSAWIGEQLALSGIDCHYQTRVGDNIDRMVLALRAALARNEAVVVCGGLGPTQDDLTREAITEVMGTKLVRQEELIERIAERFRSRGREMPESNLRQADVPIGATPIVQTRGTAPGLICPVGHKVLYAVPGVPFEMREMLERAVLPDLRRRAAERGEAGVIVSRTLRTWGVSEAGLGEIVAPRFDALDEARAAGDEVVPTIAFLASGIEGLKLRLTAKGSIREVAEAAVAEEEVRLRGLLGDVVFGVDDESMEVAVARQLVRTGLDLAVAESLTGGLAASRLVGIEGASNWFRGGAVVYATASKQSLLSVPDDLPAVSAGAAEAMAAGVRLAFGAGVGLSTTGVAGPTELDGQPVGTVFVGLAVGDAAPVSVELHLPGDRQAVRQYATISAFDLLRRRLRDLPAAGDADELAD
jgi:nicotinamide-nucleotide amidase